MNLHHPTKPRYTYLDEFEHGIRHSPKFAAEWSIFAMKHPQMVAYEHSHPSLLNHLLGRDFHTHPGISYAPSIIGDLLLRQLRHYETPHHYVLRRPYHRVVYVHQFYRPRLQSKSSAEQDLVSVAQYTQNHPVSTGVAGGLLSAL